MDVQFCNPCNSTSLSIKKIPRSTRSEGSISFLNYKAQSFLTWHLLNYLAV